MKQIRAHVRRHKKDAVRDALHHLPGISGMTIIDVQGWGRVRRHAEEPGAAG